MNLAEMQEKRGRLVKQAREALDEIKANTDEARAAELDARHDTIMGEFDAIEKLIEREQKLADIEKRANEAEQRAREKQRPNSEGEARGSDAGEALEYRQAFHELFQNGGDIGSVSSEARNLLKGGNADSEVRQQLTTTGAAGGFTVPTELRDMLIEAMEATGPMYDGGLVTEIVTSGGGEIQIPSVDDTGDSSTVAHTEGTEPADDNSGDIALGQQILNAYVYKTPFVKWSLELGQDGIFNFETLLSRLLGRRMGKLANSYLTIGTGSNQPNGVVNASSAGLTAAAVAAVTGDELINLQDSLDEAYEGNSTWMMNKATRSAIRKLKDGDNNYLWQMGNIQSGTPTTLLDRPVRLNEAMPSLGADNKPILYGDFSEYYVRKVGTPVIGVMKEKFWPNLGVAGLIRFDGEIGDSRAIKHIANAAS